MLGAHARPHRSLPAGAAAVFVVIAFAACSGERFNGLPDATSGGAGNTTGPTGNGGTTAGNGGQAVDLAEGTGGNVAGTGGGPGSGGGPTDSGGPPDAAQFDVPAADTGTDVALKLPPPPATWTEHWFEHNQVLDLLASNDDVAIYVDKDVTRPGTEWMLPALTSAWQYTRKTYGEFKSATTDGRFYAIFHQAKYGGCHPGYYFDAGHDFRNTGDCGPGPWVVDTLGPPAVMLAYIVQSTNNGVSGFPLGTIFSGSRMIELYQYDLYVALGRTNEAQALHDNFVKNTDTLPQAGTFWFRDWFYPLWLDHGHSQLLVNFFKLLSTHFPKMAGRYTRNMNLGEFVHFMSGAAGTNLKAQALMAFGANHPTDAEFNKARTDFAMITY